MAQVGSVVMVKVVEWQVDEVEHDVPQRDGHHEQSVHHRLVAHRHVESEAHAVQH